MLRIYGHAGAPNVRKVLWGAAELGVACEIVPIGGPHGGADRAEYRALNPNGRIPTIDDGGFILWESHAILRYLARKVGNTDLYPDGLQERAVIEQWLDWQAAHQAQAVRDLGRLFMASPTPPAEPLERARIAAEPIFRILEGQLAKSAYIAGPRFSLPDIPIAIGFKRWAGLPIERPSLPATEAWFARVSARPAFPKG